MNNRRRSYDVGPKRFHLATQKDTDPLRTNSKFAMTGSLLTPLDRQKPHLLTDLIYQERIRKITRRVSLPTITATNKSHVVKHEHVYHDQTFLNVWDQMFLYNKHFQGRIYDDLGNALEKRGKRMPVVGQKVTNADSRFHETSGVTFQYRPRESYYKQWATHQRHYRSDLQ